MQDVTENHFDNDRLNKKGQQSVVNIARSRSALPDKDQLSGADYDPWVLDKYIFWRKLTGQIRLVPYMTLVPSSLNQRVPPAIWKEMHTPVTSFHSSRLVYSRPLREDCNWIKFSKLQQTRLMIKIGPNNYFPCIKRQAFE